MFVNQDASVEQESSSVKLKFLIRADAFFWGPLMAAALLGSVPVALIYTLFVEQYVAGLTAGAVKG